MDLGISRHQCEAFALCLPDQHAVEGIPVDRRETTGHDACWELMASSRNPLSRTRSGLM
jgi:hypothetical protein